MDESLANPCVLLAHHLPDGTFHYDWLLDPGDNRPLIAFRTQAYIPDVASFDATRIQPHRRLYLEYEGPISGNRGEVRRIASGRCIVQVDAVKHFTADVCFDGLDSIWVRIEGEPFAYGAQFESGAEGDGGDSQEHLAQYRFISSRLG